MIIIAKLCSFVSVIYLVKLFLYPLFKPVSNKQKKRARFFVKEQKKEKLNENFRKFKQDLAYKYGKKLLGKAEKIRYQKIIDRLDMTEKPEEIRITQILYSGAAVLVTIFMITANPLLGCATAIFIVLGWLYPIDSLEKTIERKNKNISLDFPAFYSMVYYQYSKSVNIFLSDVIKDYLPNANPDMAEELGVMLDNIEYGEEYALKQLKKRVPLHYILKFCDIMETRLKGYDNVSQMTYLKNEVDEFRITALEEELEKRKNSNSRIQIVLIVVLMAYIVIYYLFTIMASLKMFQ